MSKEELNQKLDALFNKKIFKKENTEEAVRLIIAGADINLKDYQNSTLLILSAISIDTEMMEQLMGKDADFDEGNSEIVRLLIDCGADVNVQNQAGMTALMFVAFSGDIGLVELLIDNGANVDLTQGDGGTALFYAVFQGHTEIVKLLLDSGAKININDNTGKAPLIAAAKSPYSSIEMARLLIDKGAEVDSKDNYGKTALFYAARSDRRKIVELLINNGADPIIGFESDVSVNDLEQYGYMLDYIERKNSANSCSVQ